MSEVKKCPKCGTKMEPAVLFGTRPFERVDEREVRCLHVARYESFRFLKETGGAILCGPLLAFACLKCGYVELYTGEFARKYEEHLKSERYCTD
jgi:hypothetical protein